MHPVNELRFAISDRINGVEVGPRHVPLSLLGDFQKEVSDFLKGSNRDVDPAEVLVSVEEGSLALVVTGLIAASTLWVDLERIQSSISLNYIDAKRAAVFDRWQTAARQHLHRKYQIADAAALAACANYLQREIALVQPKVILAMGRLAMQVLLSQDHPHGLKLPLGKLRGQVWHYQGVPVVVTYPPAYLLRSGQDKARAWEDLCLALDVVRSKTGSS